MDWILNSEGGFMASADFHADTIRIAEPTTVPEFSNTLSRVAADGCALIIQRDGRDIAAVISIDQLEMLKDAEAREHAELVASQINWQEYGASHPPPQAWFDGDEPKPW
jgi:hypothetical protein